MGKFKHFFFLFYIIGFSQDLTTKKIDSILKKEATKNDNIIIQFGTYSNGHKKMYFYGNKKNNINGTELFEIGSLTMYVFKQPELSSKMTPQKWSALYEEKLKKGKYTPIVQHPSPNT